MGSHKNLLLVASAITLCFAPGGATAQEPTPGQMVVQAASAPAAAPAKVSKPTTVPAMDSGSSPMQTAIKALQQAKAANDETLKKQEATLQQLDDLQKAVDQLKIFAKRG